MSAKIDMRLEVDIIPVSDVDRSKAFYERLGWRLDDDVAPMDGLRIVQFTPPGSGTSITFGLGLTTAAPGSAEAGLIVSDIEAAHAELVGRGIEVSDIWHGLPFPAEARQPGPDPERTSYGSFFSITDPDGNTWLVHEVTTRLPGRVDAAETAFVSTADLASALRRAEAAHREHEKGTGRSHLFHRSGQDGDWPGTGPPGTPRTWWRSRPGRTCQRGRFRDVKTYSEGEKSWILKERPRW
jgi:catechol 2,3-dioxygenase-like lactoylglutathione lyase family enzyme